MKFGDKIDKFGVLRQLSVGGMGVIYLAYDATDDSFAVLKVLLSEYSDDPSWVARFEREAKILRKLDHPGIVRLLDTGMDRGLYFMALEFVRGITLAEVIQKRRKLPLALVVRLGRVIASTLEHAHVQGFVHRDIKPENIMVLGQKSIKILDFGIASELSEVSNTSPGQFIGTLNYAAPEQIQGQTIDQRTDLYALGLLLYEMLTGQPAITATTLGGVQKQQQSHEILPPSQLDPQVPGNLDPLIMKLLEPEPARRYPRATEFLLDLDACDRRFKSTILHSRSVYDFPELVIQFQQASTALEQRDLDRALTLADDLSKKAARAPEVFFLLGRINVERGQVYAGIREYIKATAFDPENAFYRLSLAIGYEKLGMVPQAKAEYQAVLQMDPESASAKKRLTELEKRGDQNPDAVSERIPAPTPAPAEAVSSSLASLTTDDLGPVLETLRPPLADAFLLTATTSFWWGAGSHLLGLRKRAIWISVVQVFLVLVGLGGYGVHIAARHHKLPSDGRFWAFANDGASLITVGLTSYGLGLLMSLGGTFTASRLLRLQGHVLCEADAKTHWITVNIGLDRGVNQATVFTIYEEKEPGSGRGERIGCMFPVQIVANSSSGLFRPDYKGTARIGQYVVAQSTLRSGLVDPEEPSPQRFSAVATPQKS